MVSGPDASHDMLPAQADALDALLRATFGGPGEADLVRRLRAAGSMWIERFKQWAGRINARPAVTRTQAPTGAGCRVPIAVLPPWQRDAPAATLVDPTAFAS